MEPSDVRKNFPSVALSDREQAFTDQARGDIPFSRYAREALLEKAARDLGVSLDDMESLDTARRPAPRRPNYAHRQDKQREARKR
jgi:hypothetical protein